MKNLVKTILTVLTVMLLLSATSCNPKSSLAKKLEGTWATNSEAVDYPGALHASAVRVLQFNTDSNIDRPTGGDMMISIMLNVTTMAPASDSVVQPYSISSSAIAAIQGSWKAIDDDEILVDLNPQTFTVDVDPQAVTQNDNILTGENFSTVDSLKPALASEIKRQIQTGCLQKLLSVKKIEDIEFRKDGTMKCEINDTDFHFHSQSQTD